MVGSPPRDSGSKSGRSRIPGAGIGSRRMPPRTRYITTRDGRSIAWTTVGDGPIDLLYVPQSISAMEHIWDHPRPAQFFARLASFTRLIMFDRRGSGMSERLQEPATLEEQIDDVRAVL